MSALGAARSVQALYMRVAEAEAEPKIAAAAAVHVSKEAPGRRQRLHAVAVAVDSARTITAHPVAGTGEFPGSFFCEL